MIGPMAAMLIAMTGLRDAHGQPWSVDVSVGRINYAAATTDLGTAHLMGAVRYETAPWAGVYGAGALPLRAGDPLWIASGGGGRWLPAGSNRHPVTVGVDFAAEGFVFRDRLVERNGSGAVVDALPFARWPAERGHVEVRAGWRGHALSHLGVADRRGVVETGVRLVYDAALQFEADTRLVHADGTTYPFISGALSGGRRVHVRIDIGKGLSDTVSDVAWGARVTAPVGPHATLWAGVRQDAPDPLFWNAPRRTWSVGVTRRIGRPRPMSLSGPVNAGTVVIRVAARDVPGDALMIAGDFNAWQPVPMRREGEAWVVRLPLAAGVYHCAFRSATGAWFVPESVGSRRDDGFGGHIAILVVS